MRAVRRLLAVGVALAGLGLPASAQMTANVTTAPDTLSLPNGDVRSPFMTAGGRILVDVSSSASAIGPVPVTSTTSALVGKASPGNLYGFSFTQGAGAGFFAVLNATAAPAGGAAISPLECVPVAAGTAHRSRQTIPDRFTTGVVIVSTSSCTTYTAVTPLLMEVLIQ